MNRREFLIGAGTMAVGACGLLLPDVAAARTDDFWTKDRVLDIRRSQTGERARIQFFKDGNYISGAYQQLCYMLRDVADRNAMVSMDIGLFNLIWGAQEWARMAGIPDPYYTANSGYRTPAHNAATEGAARNSLHIKGQAGDGKLRGLDPNRFGAMLTYYKVGGVGIYDGFVHADTGRVRYWRGA
ncbi:YcbK family protein [Hydromonas duriensis]|uniref:Murein endopeptidase K n=1 Tax=Hydromonas duriensis TaxID=1527608 RepID=A0A4R6Y6W3_9BURK|nr:DUF882 domain-containing protein [Hydromonas duriensis]TDR28948.1 uncharacterized protein YcbK (DUF882 family) [Hydromonas duriensis]